MPRTKITKKVKLKRETDIREEKIRIFELKKDSFIMSLDDMEVRYKTMVDKQIQRIESQLPAELSEMKMPVFLELLLQLDNFSDFKPSDHTQHVAKPAPLRSAREPRSRSACDGNKVLAKASATPSCTRSKLPRPLATHKRSLSADGMPRQKHQSLASTPPVAFLRWPKPGELAISKFGSPILAQVQPTNIANVIIPIRDGVLSLRPTKLDEIKPDLLKNLNANTLNQIRTLKENLQLIIEAADKAGMK